MMNREILEKEATQKKLNDFSMIHLKREQKNRMFNFVTRTWNPVIGCKHDCSYCWARKLTETKLKEIPRYKNGFKPKLVKKELSKQFKEGKVIFVSDMGDLWGSWVPNYWILSILDVIKKSLRAKFLFLTKNPGRYLEFFNVIPYNAILGATIETNRSTKLYSNAPLPEERLKAMQEVRRQWNGTIMVAIEPIMDFDLDKFLSYLEEIEPDFVVIGKDNYGNNLPEPSLKKILAFSYKLERFTKVILKGELREYSLHLK